MTARDRKALDLIERGAVSLLPGRKYAIGNGNGKATYRVNRDGCVCTDWQKRGEQVGPCKHMIAARALCGVYRVMQDRAKRTGRCRMPAALARALANGTAATVARKRRTAALVDDQSDLIAPNDLNPVAAD